MLQRSAILSSKKNSFFLTDCLRILISQHGKMYNIYFATKILFIFKAFLNILILMSCHEIKFVKKLLNLIN